MGIDLEPAEIVEEIHDAVIEHIRREVPWRPGARELLADLNAAGVPCALVTMSYLRFVEPMLDALPPGTFDVVVTGDAVERGKPYPDPYLEAARLLGVDPAGAYDFGSWNIEYNIFQQLMTVPANGSDPEPDLADCAYDDPQTITCKLTEGAKFSNGDDLTSSDVLFSFKRNIEIADPNGASVLLGSISNGDADNPGLADGAIETPDDTTVVFHLNQPDQTFMQVITSASNSIVDEETFPADDKLADDDTENIVGYGP
jgi:ABC-type transport system substrate-binding protein